MQYARPSSDIENPGGWATTPLWEKIDEEPFDDLDYVESPRSATGDSFTIGLSGVIDPEVHTDHAVRIRVKTGVSGTFKYELMQGAVVIKDSGDVVLTTAFAEYNMTLSEAEAANITDYTALRARVTAVATQKNQRQNVSWIRVDVPDLAGEEHSGVAAISGNGSASGTIKKGGLGSAIKSAGGTLLVIALAGMLGIASVAGGGAQIVVAKKAVSGSVSISGGGSIVATGMKAEGEEHFGTASISGNGALVAGGIKQAAVDVTIGANGVLSGAGEKQSLGDSVVTGGGSVIATGEKYEGEEHSGVAVVSGNGVIDAAVIKQALADLAISGNGIFGGNGIKQAPGDSTIIGGGSIVAVGTMSESHFGVAIISESGVIDGAGIKQAPGNLVIIGGGFIVAAGYGQEAFIEVVKTVFLKSKLTERLVELKSAIKPSIVLNSEIKPEGEE